MNKILFAKQNADLPDSVYDLSTFLRERLWENSDYFHYGEDEVREFGDLVGDLFQNIKISSDDTSDHVLENVRNYLSNKNITGSDEGLILSLIEGGLQIAHDALAERLKLIDIENRNAGEEEVAFIQAQVSEVPLDVRISVQAKLAAVLDLSPEEVIRVAHEIREAAA